METSSSPAQNSISHHHSAYQVLGTPDSLLPPSEPPNVKNWFSSYEYESLVLETNDNFGFSDHQESEGYREESIAGNMVNAVENSKEFIGKNDGTMKKKTSSMLVKCNQSVEDHKCENQCLEQVFDSPNSPMLSPEPPGIENWFSSYAYESPALDTIDNLIPSDHKESIVDKEECCNGKRKEVQKGENLSVQDDLICNQTSEGQRLKELDYGSTKDDKNSTENLQNKLPKETNHEPVAINVNSSENAQRSLIKLSCRRDLTNKCNEGNSQKDEVEANGDSWQRTGSCKSEDVGNGFVSIKSKRGEDENSMHGRSMNESTQLKNQKTASSVGNMKDGSMRRKTLADLTNVQHSSVTGKWKCPRKSKPDIGPPLKQLRLGQWFHHV